MLATGDRPAAGRALAIAALAALDLPAAADRAADLARLVDRGPVRRRGAARRRVRRPEGGPGRAGDGAGRPVDRRRVARRAGRAARGAGADGAALVDALAKAGRPGRRRRLVEAARRAGRRADRRGPPGDPRAGRRCSAAAELNCLKCHAIAGVGGRSGRAWSRSAPAPRSTTWSIRCWRPTRRSRRATTRSCVATTDGQVITGRIKVAEIDRELTLSTPTCARSSIPKADGRRAKTRRAR